MGQVEKLVGIASVTSDENYSATMAAADRLPSRMSACCKATKGGQRRDIKDRACLVPDRSYLSYKRGDAGPSDQSRR